MIMYMEWREHSVKQVRMRIHTCMCVVQCVQLHAHCGNMKQLTVMIIVMMMAANTLIIMVNSIVRRAASLPDSAVAVYIYT